MTNASRLQLPNFESSVLKSLENANHNKAESGVSEKMFLHVQNIEFCEELRKHFHKNLKKNTFQQAEQI